MSRLFGTDGVRGIANQELTPDLAFRLGRAGAYVLGRETGKRFIIIGKDTRISGDMLEGALIAGICAQGMDVWRLGIIPTPAVAYLTQELGAAAGVVISASHNPYQDNGIKFFSSNGFKLFDEVEEEIEDILLNGRKLSAAVGSDIGRVFDKQAEQERYIQHLMKTVDGKFTGKKIIIDCANGASFYVAPEVWKRLGADVTAINTRYDGTNINLHCGSTHPEGLQEAVVANGADFGIAHDGDADRVIMVDHLGREVDGDKILYICGSYLLEEGRLPGNTIVGTVMSNLGLDLAFRKKGGCVEKTKVGDRYVLERMLEKGYVLGGEQSGHVIFTEYGTTGDGLLTALQTANVLEKKKASLAELADEVQTVPQKLVNVRVKDKSRLSDNPVIAAAIAKGEKELGDMGRILVRPSGTEPLIRVMVEALDHEQLDRILDAVVQAVENELG